MFLHPYHFPSIFIDAIPLKMLLCDLGMITNELGADN